MYPYKYGDCYCCMAYGLQESTLEFKTAVATLLTKPLQTKVVLNALFFLLVFLIALPILLQGGDLRSEILSILPLTIVVLGLWLVWLRSVFSVEQ